MPFRGSHTPPHRMTRHERRQRREQLATVASTARPSQSHRNRTRIHGTADDVQTDRPVRLPPSLPPRDGIARLAWLRHATPPRPQATGHSLSQPQEPPRRRSAHRPPGPRRPAPARPHRPRRHRTRPLPPGGRCYRGFPSRERSGMGLWDSLLNWLRRFVLTDSDLSRPLPSLLPLQFVWWKIPPFCCLRNSGCSGGGFSLDWFGLNCAAA